MMLEQSRHEFSVFVTLTYAEAPEELVPDHMAYFVRRLRLINPRPLRFYGVGEYGSKGGRPHYHLALFGVSMADEALIQSCWTRGFVHIGELNRWSAQYLTKYVCKSLVQLRKHDGKHPEFARMSLRPGLVRQHWMTLRAILCWRMAVVLSRQILVTFRRLLA